MQVALSILTLGISTTAWIKSVDFIQGYAIAFNTVAEVLFENGRALWAAVWLLGGGVTN